MDIADGQISLMQGGVETAQPRIEPERFAGVLGALPSVEPPSLANLLGVGARAVSRNGDQRGFFLRRILLLADVLALVFAFAAAELGLGFQAHGHDTLARDLLLLAFAIPGWVMLARAHDLYHVDSRRSDHSAADELAPIVWMTTLWSWSILLVTPLLGLHSPSVPKLAAFWLFTVVFLVLLRSGARAWARRQDWYVQNAIVVGDAAEAAAVVPKILRHPEYGMNLVACVELCGDDAEAKLILDDDQLPVIRGNLDLVELIRELDVNRVIFGPSLYRVANSNEVLSDLKQLHLHVDMVPSWCDVVGSRVELHELEGMPLITIPDVSLGRSSLMCKRALDVVSATLGLLLLLPVLIACAVAIKWESPGPILFRQRRVGRDDRRFEVLKFRTMCADAEGLKETVAPLNLHGGGLETGMFKIEGDPRITRVGRWLRRYSLDELPQLINVLRGDMSLVGPRPLIENEDSQVAGRHRRRITLTPGLTGLWQVNGRSDIPFKDMIDLDYLYVTNWSLWGDVKLLMRTFAAVTRGRGAY